MPETPVGGYIKTETALEAAAEYECQRPPLGATSKLNLWFVRLHG